MRIPRAVLGIHKDAGVAKAEQIEELKAELAAANADLARLRRRWAGHVAVCPVAQQLELEDEAKKASNQ